MIVYQSLTVFKVEVSVHTSEVLIIKSICIKSSILLYNKSMSWYLVWLKCQDIVTNSNDFTKDSLIQLNNIIFNSY